MYIERILPILLLVIFIASCDDHRKHRMVENTGQAQGSTYQIKYITNKNVNFEDEFKEIFKTMDQSMSMWVENSLISQVNKGNVWVEVDPIFLTVLHRSLEVAEETNGDFEPTIGPLVRLWGFGFDEVRDDITEEKIHQVRSMIGYKTIEIDENKVRIPENGSLDFNAIAQGYTVDHIAEYLEKHGIKHYMIEIGGEIRAKGTNHKGKTWTIGVDKPQTTIDSIDKRFQFILKLKNAGLATSGNYRNFWIDEETGLRYSHTIDPQTGRPAMDRLLSASIIAPSAMDADAYATVCMVQGLEKCISFLSKKPELEGYLIYTNENGDWREYITEGFREVIVDH